MAEGKKSFWMTVPGLISGIAATVTGLGVLIPILLGVGGKHTNKNTASQNSSPGVTSTSTAGGSTGGTSGPGSTPLPTDSASGSTESPLGITADPSSVNVTGKAAD